MTVNILSRKLIKPSNPTPPHLRTYNISLIDELNPSMHVIRILFFPQSDHAKLDYACLEQSLAQVLPLFYPLAGRYNKENHHVDCNDEGAEYAVAQVVDRKLHQLIGAESEKLNQLLPLDICAADEPTDPMLAIQINNFQCGGLAIGVCASHRIFDSASLGIFLTTWANAAASTNADVIIRPDFDSPIYFPSENLPPLQFQVSRTRDKSIVTKRFVFDKNAIARLRERLTSSEEGGRRLDCLDPGSSARRRGEELREIIARFAHRAGDQRTGKDGPARGEALVRDVGFVILPGARTGRKPGYGAQLRGHGYEDARGHRSGRERLREDIERQAVWEVGSG
ncbi:acetyl-coa-benzylalcohol acetyltransferase [Phtheirospermum japonicum]|uniref:Acetyl-coa-benzylalcohol acetyltransferase n=1 Tax=Phtheirospermum japonicum TaxID=374723 RepID=A0A830BSY7_9LAMI|nr:acetyl-coa-benzylalcohol acetyltransferase [Phtheirospermum japonicum]